MRLAYLFASVLISAPAFAADLGTYRPGAPYHSVIVPTANICESQCAGDARCQSWNYVKAAPQAPGVCEFQSESGPAVSSAISISGLSSGFHPVSDRVVRGGTNTIRVGTSVAPTPQPSVAQPSAVQQRQRRIVRQPIPSANPYQSQAAMQRGPAFQPALGGYGAAPSPVPQRPSAQAPALVQQPLATRGPARMPYAQRQMGSAPVGQHAASAQIMPPQMMRPQTAQPQGRPPIGQPIAAPQPQMIPATTPQQPMQVMPRSSAQAPVTWQNAQQFNVTPQPYSQPQTQARQQAQPAPSLYGNLNDDMGPAPQTGMPTVVAAPTVPVAQSPLAGAPPR